ncbi:RNA polymerase sigma factor SigJ [Microbacterium barkeri]
MRVGEMSARPDPAVDAEVRRHLVGVAYRLLGSVSEAEDAVQEGLARWYALSAEGRAAIGNPAAWLTTAVSRVCLDVLKSARVKRESYVGPWLPEPVPDAAVLGLSPDPLDAVAAEETLSMAVLVLLERLTAPQRVAFVLHDVFGFSFAEVSEVMGRSTGACRELASQARRRVRTEGRARVTRGELARSVAAFKVAWETGDVAGLVEQLEATAVATVDGGGRVSAAREPIVGAEAIARFFAGVRERQPDLVVREMLVNGTPGLVALDAAGAVLATVSVEVAEHGIRALWVVRNPDKLGAWRDVSVSRVRGLSGGGFGV